MLKFCPIFSAILMLFIACQSTIKTNNDNSQSKAKMANPASVRCLNDGYQLEPVVENGVTVGHMCVNPETGLKCEEWRYFRDECSLKQDD